MEPDVAGLEQPSEIARHEVALDPLTEAEQGAARDACIRSEVPCRASPAIRAAAPSPRSACRSRARRRRSPPGRVMCRRPGCGGRLLRPRLLFRPHGTGRSWLGAATGVSGPSVTPAAPWCQQERQRGGLGARRTTARRRFARRRRGVAAPGIASASGTIRSPGIASINWRCSGVQTTSGSSVQQSPAESGTSRDASRPLRRRAPCRRDLLEARNCS